jgi:Fe-S cluster assembly ATP-binding protein
MRSAAGLLITHAGYLLNYVNADIAYVMFNGSIHCSGNPMDLLEDIKNKGYDGCLECRREN